MFEIEWWETALEELMELTPRGRGEAAARLAEDYFSMVEDPRQSREEIQGLLADIIRHMEAPLPPFVVVSAPDQSPLTPDDLVIEPAWNKFEVERLWGIHDGRSYGTQVVGVYALNREGPLPVYKRDQEWGILGHANKNRASNPDDPEDQI